MDLNIAVNVPANYKRLGQTVERALRRIIDGKGAQRHSGHLPWVKQPMFDIGAKVGSGFAIGQVLKKIDEALRMEDAAAVNELLDCIGYLAGAIETIEEGNR